VGGLDALGTLVIAGLSYREGREAFEKARAGSLACACGRDCAVNGKHEEPGTGNG
jgi:hypothetical protein